MFKEALSAVTSSIVGATKRTAEAYRPSNSVAEGGAFERIAQQGIVNMSYRSPVMADMAQTMLKSFQIEVARKQKIQAHVKSEDSSALREAVTKDMGDGASAKKIDSQMESILSKMNSTLEKSGAEEAKKSDIFSKYGKYFEDFRKTSTTPTQPSEGPTDPKGGSGGLDGNATATLAKIEINTLRTYNALEVYMSRHNLAGGTGGASPAGGASGNSFIDPLTGMPSITAAIGHIGGSFLGKVFDDATIDKFAAKTKKLLNLDEVEEVVAKQEKKVSPKKGGAAEKSISDILGDLNLDLNTSAEAKPVVKEELPDSKINTPEEVAAQSAKQSDKLESVSKEILNEIRAGNATVAATPGVVPQKPSRVPTAKEFFKEKVASRNTENLAKKNSGIAESIATAKQSANYIPKGIPLSSTVPLGGALTGGATTAATAATGGASAAATGGIGSAILGGLGVLGAGVAGVVAGSSAVNPLIDKGISAATGHETSLGGYIYDKMNDDPMAVMASKKVSAAPSKTTASVAALTAEKAKKDTAASAGGQPIIIASGGNSAPAQAPSSSTTNVGIAPAVRNQESTFERVQMQDFWPRTA